MKYEIKNKFTGNTIFECELDASYRKEPLSIQLGMAVKLAFKGDADLRGADLRGANLQGADLRGANLRGANLRGANLQDANLQDANLQDANLRGADLRGANLRGADLRGADLKDTKWNDEVTIQRAPLFVYGLHWTVTILDEHMKIGCELHSLAEWTVFDDDQINCMDHNALEFWQKHKTALLALAESDGRINGLKRE